MAAIAPFLRTHMHSHSPTPVHPVHTHILPHTSNTPRTHIPTTPPAPMLCMMICANIVMCVVGVCVCLELMYRVGVGVHARECVCVCWCVCELGERRRCVCLYPVSVCACIGACRGLCVRVCACVLVSKCLRMGVRVCECARVYGVRVWCQFMPSHLQHQFLSTSAMEQDVRICFVVVMYESSFVPRIILLNGCAVYVYCFMAFCYLP